MLYSETHCIPLPQKPLHKFHSGSATKTLHSIKKKKKFQPTFLPLLTLSPGPYGESDRQSCKKNKYL